MAALSFAKNARPRPETPSEVLLITKSDTTVYDPPLQWISIGTAGALAVIMGSDTAAVTIPANALVIGVQHRMEVTKVMSTNTAAAEIVGWR